MEVVMFVTDYRKYLNLKKEIDKTSDLFNFPIKCTASQTLHSDSVHALHAVQYNASCKYVLGVLIDLTCLMVELLYV